MNLLELLEESYITDEVYFIHDGDHKKLKGVPYFRVSKAAQQFINAHKDKKYKMQVKKMPNEDVKKGIENGTIFNKFSYKGEFDKEN